MEIHLYGSSRRPKGVSVESLFIGQTLRRKRRARERERGRGEVPFCVMCFRFRVFVCRRHLLIFFDAAVAPGSSCSSTVQAVGHAGHSLTTVKFGSIMRPSGKEVVCCVLCVINLPVPHSSDFFFFPPETLWFTQCELIFVQMWVLCVRRSECMCAMRPESAIM